MTRRSRKMSGEQRDDLVTRLLRNEDSAIAARVRGDNDRSKARLAENDQLLARLSVNDRHAIEESLATRRQLSNRAASAEFDAYHRRTLINLVDDVAGAMWAISPKKLTKDRKGWAAADTRDADAIAAIWDFIRRHDLLTSLNALRDRALDVHHARLAAAPRDKMEDLLDEIGAERAASIQSTLEPEDVEAMADRLEQEGVQWGSTRKSVRKKDVASALKRSESFLRVRKLRQKKTVTPTGRKKR